MEENKPIQNEEAVKPPNNPQDAVHEQLLNNPSTDETIVPAAETTSEAEQPKIDQSEIPITIGATNYKPETEDMEVHHHAHDPAAPHHKKNLKSYFWEFLMLFLAVFCGFLAEYQLEHVIEHQREKQYIESLVADLKSDQEVISQHIIHVKSGISMMDSMIAILNAPSQIANHTGELYFLARLAPRLKPLSNNNRTFEQLKNSGNFRLIRNLNTSNKIMTYYEKFPLVRLLESVNETEFTEYKKVASKIFNPAILIKMEGMNSEIHRISYNPSLHSTGNELLQELSVFSVYMHGTKTGILKNDEEMKIAGAELIEYLQKEYQFK